MKVFLSLVFNVPLLKMIFEKFINSETCLLLVFVDDDAFGLKKNMMRPYLSCNRTLEEKVFDLSNFASYCKIQDFLQTNKYKGFNREVRDKLTKWYSVHGKVIIWSFSTNLLWLHNMLNLLTKSFFWFFIVVQAEVSSHSIFKLHEGLWISQVIMTHYNDSLCLPEYTKWVV